MYMEAIDAIINSVKDRFEQPGFQVFGQVEQLLLKSIRKNSAVDEMETLQANFKGDYDPNFLMTELELLPVLSGSSNQSTLEMSSKSSKSLSYEKPGLIRNAVVIIKIVLTNGATSATPERSFPMLR